MDAAIGTKHKAANARLAAMRSAFADIALDPGRPTGRFLKRRIAPAILVLIPVAGLVRVGPSLLAHVLFSLGFTSAYARLVDDPGWRGYELAKAGRYGEAAKAFGTAPTDAYDRGNALARAGLYRQALDAYDAALDADPEDADARHNRTVVAQILDDRRTPSGVTTGNANAAATRERYHGGVGNQDGDTNSTGIGFVGNKEGSSSRSQGGSKVAKTDTGPARATESNSSKGSGSAGQASGRGRNGGDLADWATSLHSIFPLASPKFINRSIQPNVEWLQTLPDDPGSFLKLQIRAEHKRRLAHAEDGHGASD